jgi:hypothetical protein
LEGIKAVAVFSSEFYDCWIATIVSKPCVQFSDTNQLISDLLFSKAELIIIGLMKISFFERLYDIMLISEKEVRFL